MNMDQLLKQLQDNILWFVEENKRLNQERTHLINLLNESIRVGKYLLTELEKEKKVNLQEAKYE